MSAEYENKTCGTCKHWFRLKEATNIGKDARGLCRRMPMTVTHVAARNSPTGFVQVVGYPNPQGVDPACAEHAERLALVGGDK